MTLIIGIGNRWRGDDGAGPHAAEILRKRGFDAIEENGEGARLIAAFEGRESVVIVDAMRSDAAPGTVRRFDAAHRLLPVGLFHYSSHQFALAEAVETARALRRLPRKLVIYGIEGVEFGYGEGLSPTVQAAAEAVAETIAAEVPAPRPLAGG